MATPFPDSILMVRPASFSYDPGTAASNTFQKKELADRELQEEALNEFERVRERLEELGVELFIVDDTPDPAKPNAVFPNNWISFHEDGTVVLYPMLTDGRRKERRPELPKRLEEETRFRVRRTIDLSSHEKEDRPLEGTGSIVFDRNARIAYACRSSRTDIGLFEHICERIGYKPVSFEASDEKGGAIYHTNVMLALGDHFAIICEEAIEDPLQQKMVKMQLQDSGKELISIDRQQMKAFAGNGYQVTLPDGRLFFLLSKRACDALTADQLRRIEARTAVECLPVERIEDAGGGSVRCMLAGIFLPEKDPEKG
jgi:hypothetical protein